MDKLVVFVIVAFGTAATTAVAMIVSKQVGLGDLAAWVQAVGSIVAIYWAGHIARRQSKEAQHAAVEQNRLQMEGLGAMLGHLLLPLYAADMALKQAMEPYERVEAARKVRGGLQDAVAAAQRIPFHEMPYAYVASSGLGFSRQLEMASAAVSELADQGLVGERFDAAVLIVSECCTRAELRLKQIEDFRISDDGTAVTLAIK